MLEIEAKIRVSSLETVRERLAALDSEQQGGTRHERDVYWNAPDRDFSVTDEALRLRYADGECILTYKGAKIHAAGLKAREELNLVVGDGATLEMILSRLGFSRTAVVEKQRETYRVPGATVTLDNVRELGTFIEIEAEVGMPEADAVRRINELTRNLGVSSEYLTQSYLEMLLDTMQGRE